MSSQPECIKCGHYVNHGPCICGDCLKEAGIYPQKEPKLEDGVFIQGAFVELTMAAVVDPYSKTSKWLREHVCGSTDSRCNKLCQVTKDGSIDLCGYDMNNPRPLTDCRKVRHPLVRSGITLRPDWCPLKKETENAI